MLLCICHISEGSVEHETRRHCGRAVLCIPNSTIDLIRVLLIIISGISKTIKWESVPRRQESWESTEPDMVPLSVRLWKRWRFRSTLLTAVSFAERTLWSVAALESGAADLAARLLPVVPTLCQPPVVLPSAVLLVVWGDWYKSKLKLNKSKSLRLSFYVYFSTCAWLEVFLDDFKQLHCRPPLLTTVQGLFDNPA